MVNSLRFAYNQTTVDRFNEDYFDPGDLGASVYNYSPTHEMVVVVTGGFNIAASTATRGIADNKTWQISEDLTLVRGRHQIALGVNVAYWDTLQKAWANGGGNWQFNGSITGLGMSDFLLGRVAIFEHGSYFGVHLNQLYQGWYAQDTWRATRTHHAERGACAGSRTSASRSPTARSPTSAGRTSAAASRARSSSTRRPDSSIRATRDSPKGDRATRSSGRTCRRASASRGTCSATGPCRSVPRTA